MSSSCDPNNPSVSFTGTLDHCTSKASKPYPIAFTLTDVGGFSCQSQTIVASDTVVVTPAPAPANMIVIDTPAAIEVQFNGGTDWLRVDRVLVATMEVSTISIRNLLVTPPADVDVSVFFSQGTPL